MSFRCVVYNTSQFRGFSHLNITNNLAKENIVFYFIVYFIHVKTLIFSLQHIQGWYKTWLNIQLKSFNTWLFSLTCLLVCFFFNWCTLIKKATIKSGKIKVTVDLCLWHVNHCLCFLCVYFTIAVLYFLVI